MKTLKVKLNVPLRGKPIGSIVLVKANDKGVPLERYWRRRFEEAKTNKCVEQVVKKKQPKVKTQITTLEG